tara:strand:- start:1184 stop:1756 length:573 start_codon:yes stop_codon:yes gene_type:complete
MKRKRKTVTKRRNMKRKTRRQRVGSGIIKDRYRAAHRIYYDGEESEGKKAEDAKRKADALQEIRNNKDYVEMKDMKDLKVGETYFEFVGEPTLKNLGKFQKEDQDGASNYMYGNNFSLIFDNGVLTGFNKGGEVYPPVTSLKGKVFKSNVKQLMAEKTGYDRDMTNKIMGFVGGRKRKTRKAKKSRRARN